MSTDIYRYVPLKKGEIRCVRILPGKGNEEISIEIQHQSWDVSVPRYNALSYTWGEPDPQHPILVSNTTKYLYVRDNCWRFLKYWRRMSPAPDAWIWIDSLCINQVDDKEKNEQVRRMGDIFKQAEQVLIWLGRISETNILTKFMLDHPYLMHWADCPPDDYPRLRELQRELENLGGVVQGWEDSERRTVHPVAQNLFDLASASYWERLWIIQELYHARSYGFILGDKLYNLGNMAFVALLCTVWPIDGRRAIGSPRLRCMTTVINELLFKLGTAGSFYEDELLPQSSWHARRETIRPGPPRSDIPLAESLKHFRNQKCSDFRDRVYSLLSLSDFGHMFAVDYQYSDTQLFKATLDQLVLERKMCGPHFGRDLLYHQDAERAFDTLKIGGCFIETKSLQHTLCSDEVDTKYNVLFDRVCAFDRAGGGKTFESQEIGSRSSELYQPSQRIRFQRIELCAIGFYAFKNVAWESEVTQIWEVGVMGLAFTICVAVDCNHRITGLYKSLFLGSGGFLDQRHKRSLLEESEVNAVPPQEDILTLHLEPISGNCLTVLGKHFTFITRDKIHADAGLLLLDAVEESDFPFQGLMCCLSASELILIYNEIDNVRR